MPNIFHQSVEDILRAATPEQRLLWNYIFLRWGERISVSQFVYLGATLGELGVYSANKIYLAYELSLTGNASIEPFSSLTLHDTANVVHYRIASHSAYYNSTALATQALSNVSSENNLWFSRLTIQNALYFKFIGYRIGI